MSGKRNKKLRQTIRRQFGNDFGLMFNAVCEWKMKERAKFCYNILLCRSIGKRHPILYPVQDIIFGVIIIGIMDILFVGVMALLTK